jgi:hypothetical protein
MTSPLYPVFLVRFTCAIWRSKQRRACWRRKRAIQAQRGGIGLPDIVEIKYVATTYLPLVRVFLKANGKRAAPGFLPTRPVLASADRLGDVQSINRDLWPQIELFRAGFAVEGSLGCPKANPPKKSGFFELFISIFSLHYYIQKSRLLNHYLPIYLFI